MRFSVVVRASTAALLIVLSGLTVGAQPAPGGATSGAQMPAADALKLQLDQRQLDKVNAELDKTGEEIKKLKREESLWWTTPTSIFVPLLLGVLTLWWQARNARDLQHRANLTELEFKIVDFVMASAAPYAAFRRWKLLKGIYGDRLSPSFVTNLDQTDFEHFPGPRLPEMRMALFNALAQKPESHDQVIAAFRQVFWEEDLREWFKRTLQAERVVRPSQPAAGSSSPAQES
jgi:hypothetical protein